MKFESIGVLIPDILLPEPAIAPETWAVIACDQYSSEPEYWDEVAAITGEKPSTARMIFPEAYLNSGRDEAIIEQITASMNDYLSSGVFKEYAQSLILTRRQTSTGERRGVLIALDLEHYSYSPGEQTLIRATEGTIVDRLPPRMKVRRNAPLEFPHIMVLIDDPKCRVIEPLFRENAEPLYDFKLMKGGGKLTGALLNDEAVISGFCKKLEALIEAEAFQAKYACGPETRPLLFAMGDGNHSFATAKALWEELKTQHDFDAIADHPARYALVELVNLYDESLEFEAIHRSLFNVNCREVIEAFIAYQKAVGSTVDLTDYLPDAAENEHVIGFHSGINQGYLKVSEPQHQLAAGTLQNFLDDYLASHEDAKIDYIHGEETARKLVEKGDAISFLLPAIDKHDLFRTVIFDGALPRKTFSMGEAQDKRYYMEGRKIS